MFVFVNRSVGCAFALCVLLQWNDPDPLLWMAFYAAAVAAIFLPTGSPVARPLAALIACVGVGWIVALAPGAGGVDLGDLTASMAAKDGVVEVAREIGGISLVVGWMVVLLIRGRRRSGPESSIL